VEIQLWTKGEEAEFFRTYLKRVKPEKLFYYLKEEDLYYAYYPKSYKGKKTTLQSRNTLIGEYTEEWVWKLLSKVIEDGSKDPQFKELFKDRNLSVIKHLVCEELGLGSESPADIAIIRSDKVDKNKMNSEDILLIFEVKMSIVWNWSYSSKTNELECKGDFTEHQGNPSLLRSDSMLKAIGKSLSIRLKTAEKSPIPIIVLGNTPITEHYAEMVDKFKEKGIIQGFYSLNPSVVKGLQSANDVAHSKGRKEGYIIKTEHERFLTVESYEDFKNRVLTLMKDFVENKSVFLSCLIDKVVLGRIIEKASKEENYEKMAEVFVELLQDGE